MIARDLDLSWNKRVMSLIEFSCEREIELWRCEISGVVYGGSSIQVLLKTKAPPINKKNKEIENPQSCGFKTFPPFDSR